jgi:hypothetical protein
MPCSRPGQRARPREEHDGFDEKEAGDRELQQQGAEVGAKEPAEQAGRRFERR